MTGNASSATQQAPNTDHLTFGAIIDYIGVSQRDIYKSTKPTCFGWQPEELRRFNLWPYGLVTEWKVYESFSPVTPAVLSYIVCQFEDYGSITCTCSYFKALNECSFVAGHDWINGLRRRKFCQHVAEVLIRIESWGLKDDSVTKVR